MNDLLYCLRENKMEYLVYYNTLDENWEIMIPTEKGSNVYKFTKNGCFISCYEYLTRIRDMIDHFMTVNPLSHQYRSIKYVRGCDYD